jgi:hypothetical protein
MPVSLVAHAPETGIVRGFTVACSSHEVGPQAAEARLGMAVKWSGVVAQVRHGSPGAARWARGCAPRIGPRRPWDIRTRGRKASRPRSAYLSTHASQLSFGSVPLRLRRSRLAPRRRSSALAAAQARAWAQEPRAPASPTPDRRAMLQLAAMLQLVRIQSSANSSPARVIATVIARRLRMVASEIAKRSAAMRRLDAGIANVLKLRQRRSPRVGGPEIPPVTMQRKGPTVSFGR